MRSLKYVRNKMKSLKKMLELVKFVGGREE